MEKHKGMNDVLPLDLLRRIFLRLPAKELFRLRCVSKLWHSLISDQDFAESHLNHSSLARYHSCLFVNFLSVGHFVDLDTLSFKELSLPFRKKIPFDFRVMGSCRGFVLLDRSPHFLIVWNPLTGSSKRISYSHIVSRNNIAAFNFPDNALLYGFGYDASQDDYLVVLAWHDWKFQHHLYCFSLRTNSWINLHEALPKPLGPRMWQSHGSFLHGAIHWLSCYGAYIDAILVFDLKERSFSKISIPKQLVKYSYPALTLLGGCLALFSYDIRKTYIWVMKEYKVASSWILVYDIPYAKSMPLPLCLSNGNDVIALLSTSFELQFAKYNVNGELLQEINYPIPLWYKPRRNRLSFSVYTESLLSFPGDTKDKDKKKKTGHRVRQQCFKQLDVGKD